MELNNIIQSQFLASLAMLQKAVANCPAELWDSDKDQNKYWHIAYHALFYTHLYLQPTEGDFKPWKKHQPESQFMGSVPWPPHHAPKIDRPYTQTEVLEYLEICKIQVQETTKTLNPEADSGFDWIPFGKMELQIYSIRHLMQHTGELCERLTVRAGIEVGWVGTRDPD